jgi:hypothetical protein
MALGQVGSMSVALMGDINNFNRDMDKAGAKVKGFGTQVGAVGAKVAKAGKAMALAITLPLVGFAVAAIKFAGDAEEIQSKFDAVFKEFAEQTTVWVEEFAVAINRNATDLKEYASVFQDTFVPLGFARGEAAELSMALVELTIDLASFNNASEPETMRALQSAIVGNHETVRRFGVIINQAGLNIELMNMGIKDGIKTATEAEKAQARLNLIIAGTADAQGDAARTSESFTNQMKGMKSEMKAVAEDIGAILIPHVLKLMEKIKELTSAWAEMGDLEKERIVKYLAIFAVGGPALYAVGTIAKLVPALISLWAAIAASPIGIMLAAAAAGMALNKSFVLLYDTIAGAIGDLVEGGEEAIHVTQRIIDMFVEATNAAGNVVIENVNLVGVSMDAMIEDLRVAQEAAKAALISGELEYGEAARKFQEDVNMILDNYGVMDDFTRTLFASMIEMAIASWAELTGVTLDAVGTIVREVEEAEEAVEKVARGIERAKDVIVAASVELTTLELDAARAQFHELTKELFYTAEGSLDYIVVVGKIRKAYATLIAAAEAVVEQDKEVSAGREKLIADYELLGLVLTDVVIPKTKEASTVYQDIVSSALVDITWDIVTFHRKTEAAERDHLDRMAAIDQAGFDKIADINKSDDRKREDENTAHTRRMDDIDDWYDQQVLEGAANTAEKKRNLDTKRQEKEEEAKKTHLRRLDDFDTQYTRNIEDNEADREQTLQDELEAYEEQRPKITEIVKQSFLDMVDAIVESKIKETIEGVIAQFMGLGAAAETGVAAANTALAGLNPLAMALVPLWLGGTAGGATFVQDLNKWLTDQIYGEGTYEAGRGGTVRVESYAGGGVVPGPPGVPRMVVAHGGEPIGTAGLAQVFDYEMMGRAVQAGTYEAMLEVLSKDAGRPIIVQMADGTRIAQALYNPLAAEKSRRGG